MENLTTGQVASLPALTRCAPTLITARVVEVGSVSGNMESVEITVTRSLTATKHTRYVNNSGKDGKNNGIS